MKYAKIAVATFALAGVLMISHSAVAEAATGRGLFKDIYCTLMSLVSKECTPDVDGVKVRFETTGPTSQEDTSSMSVMANIQDFVGVVFNPIGTIQEFVAGN